MRELDTKDSGQYAFAAAIDAQRRNSNNKSTCSPEDIRRAVSARELLDLGFASTALFINYRARWIAVKAEGARPRDAQARAVIKLFEELGYNVCRTAQGLIVRITRTA